MDPKKTALLKTQLFSSLADRTLSELARIAEWRVLEAGAIVFRKGDPGTHLFVIERGRVRIGADAIDGREVTFNLLGQGAVFGEIAFADEGSRTAEAVAVEQTRVLTFDRRYFLPFLKGEPEILLQMMAALAERARWISENYEDVAFMKLPARLAKRLLILSRHFGADTDSGRLLATTLRHRDLANHMNVTRESISRLIQVWRAEGVIEERRGVILLKDMARLQALARSQ